MNLENLLIFPELTSQLFFNSLYRKIRINLSKDRFIKVNKNYSDKREILMIKE